MRYSISIVSHCSGSLISLLLNDLRRVLPSESEIIVTINVPEDETFLADYQDLPIKLIRNDKQRGFGDNHNRAFKASTGQIFIVANPDIRLQESPFQSLEKSLLADKVGACAPIVLSPAGKVEDSVRYYPTIGRFLARVILRKRTADYVVYAGSDQKIEWAAGMFIVFNRAAYEEVGGFDARYFMYLEDADICRRIWAAGWSVKLVSTAKVIHDAQRASQSNLRHLCWHIRSAFRFLIGF